MPQTILMDPGSTKWDLKWKMFGIPVRVHPLFWLGALLLSMPRRGEVDLSLMLVTMACMFFSILVHEFGHAFCGRYYGDDRNSVVLYIMGGLCISGRGVPNRWPRIWQLLWGPGAGFILGGIAYGIKYALDRKPMDPVERFQLFISPQFWALNCLVWFNIVWGLFNLLPVFPLDGGQIAREVVHWKAPHRGDRLAFTISFYAAIVCTAGFLAWYLSDNGVSLFPAFLYGSLAYSNYNLLQQVKNFREYEEYEVRQPWERDPDWWKQ